MNKDMVYVGNLKEFVLFDSIKSAQIPKAGYDYQDFCVAKYFIEWFHNPNKYEWMKVECIGIEEGKTSGLDDIVAKRSDGLYELYQVKFTVDSDKYPLNFNWLLNKSKRESLLQKWAAPLFRYADKKLLHIAELCTNRKPTNDFINCLKGKYIDISRIPKDIYQEIISQLGSVEKAEIFFENFSFEHSLLNINDLENKLKDGLVPDHTNLEGWYQFLDTIRKWSRTKNSPPPDGEIRIEHIRNLLQVRVTRSISQEYKIPAGYIPPSQFFHDNLISKIKNGNAWILYGKPGIGKSTYLSYLFNNLVENGIPTVRHHYFLGGYDVTDRIQYNVVEYSLISQLKQLFPDMATQYNSFELSDWLKTCGNNCKQLGKTLVVIIDGLDHAWRERPDTNQLVHLINKFLPLPEGIYLLLGTQPLDDSKLPPKIVEYIDRQKSWIELPTMDHEAIHAWLTNLVDKGLLILSTNEKHREFELSELTKAFYKLSSGYPLHMTFSMNVLLNRKRKITSYDVERLPSCPSGDINNYYKKLWRTLSQAARKILHLFAASDFQWPDVNSLHQCLKDEINFDNAYSEIAHLIETYESGLIPFHGSILVHIRKHSDHKKIAKSLFPLILKWLNTNAPGYWKWGWKWITEANMGNPNQLINSPNRQWMIDSLCKGYPSRQIEYILSSAEKYALESNKLDRLVELRLVKTRLINGPIFQIGGLSDFIKCALTITEDNYILTWYADNLSLFDENTIEVIAISSAVSSTQIVDKAVQEIYKRFKYHVRVGFDHTNKGMQLAKILINISATKPDSYHNTTCVFIEKFDSQARTELYELYFHKLIDMDNGDLLLDINPNILNVHVKQLLADAIVRYDCNRKNNLFHNPKTLFIFNFPLGYCYYCLENNINSIDIVYKLPKIISIKVVRSKFLHDYFFSVLAGELTKTNLLEKIGFSQDAIENNLLNLVSLLNKSALLIASKVKLKEKINSFYIFELLNEYVIEKETYNHYELISIETEIIKAITEISIDIYLLCHSLDLNTEISIEDYTKVQNYKWWREILWLNNAIQWMKEAISPELAHIIISRLYLKHQANKNETSELASSLIEVTKIASAFGLNNLVLEGLRLTALNIFGYEHRKDITLSLVLDAIEACAMRGVGNIQSWLYRMLPFTNQILDFTDGKGVKHNPIQLIELINKYYSEYLVYEFSYHLSRQNWDYAEKVITLFVSTKDLSISTNRAIARCITEYKPMLALQNRILQSEDLQELYDLQIEFLGGFPLMPRQATNDSYINNTQINILFDDYPPNKIKELVNYFNENKIFNNDKISDEWIKYWNEKGKGQEIIDNFDKLYTSEEIFPFQLVSCLETVFNISYTLEGAKKAYSWALRVIKENNSWQPYWSDRGTEQLKLFGVIYRKKWEILFKESCQMSRYHSYADWGLNVPTLTFVLFLLEINQITLACNITEIMVNSLEQETKHLPLDIPLTNSEIKDLDNLGFYLLIELYKWPDSLVRKKVAYEIALLLRNDEAGVLRMIFLSWLSTLTLESDITDALSILVIVGKKIYSEEELFSKIYSHSILSHIILITLGYSLDNKDLVLLKYSKSLSHDYSITTKYMNAAKRFPSIFLDSIKGLATTLNYPLDKYMFNEWERISNNEITLSFDEYQFVSDYYYPTDKVVSYFSSRSEAVFLSAYLRTLSFAFRELGLLFQQLQEYAMSVLPFDTFYSHMLPKKPPSGWPSVNNLDYNNIFYAESDLEKILQHLFNQPELLLAANAPLIRKINGICINLSIMTVLLKPDHNLSAKDIYYASINPEHHKSLFVQLLAERIYPISIGRWQFPLVIRGIYAPSFITNYMDNRSIDNNSIIYFEETNKICRFNYWNFQWYPAVYPEIGPAIGTSLVAYEETKTNLLNNNENQICMVGEMVILDKRNRNNNVLTKMFAIYPPLNKL